MLMPQAEQVDPSIPSVKWCHDAASGARWLSLDDREQILFGMDWVALVGGPPSKLARKYVRLYRAGMHTSIHDTSAVVGLAAESIRFGGADSAFSAAGLFAQAYQDQTVACMVTLADGACWMAAAHQGQVLVQTDRWFDHIEQAQEALVEIQQRFPALYIHVHTLTALGQMPAWAIPPFSHESRLIRPRWYDGRHVRLVCFLAAFMALLFSIYKGMSGGEQDGKDVDAMRQAALAAQWKDMLSSRRVHEVDELLQLVAEWDQAPLMAGGWRLNRIDCQALAERWRCIASYERVHGLASAASLLSALPAGWHPDFMPLEHAGVTFYIESRPKRLASTQSLPASTWISQLQKISPAFEHIQVGAPHPVIQLEASADIRAGMTALDLAPLAWQQRSVMVRGPLRSFPLFKGWSMPSRWNQLTLELRQDDPVGLGKSRYMLTLLGDIFEKKH